jgi:hypothetical protein
MIDASRSWTVVSIDNGIISLDEWYVDISNISIATRASHKVHRCDDYESVVIYSLDREIISNHYDRRLPWLHEWSNRNREIITRWNFVYAHGAWPWRCVIWENSIPLPPWASLKVHHTSPGSRSVQVSPLNSEFILNTTLNHNNHSHLNISSLILH